MLDLIIFLVIVIGLTVFPVMVSAKLLNASNPTFWRSLFSVILSSTISTLLTESIANPGIAGLLSILATVIFIALILGARFWQSVLIAIIALGLQYVFLLVFAAIGFSSGVIDVSS